MRRNRLSLLLLLSCLGATSTLAVASSSFLIEPFDVKGGNDPEPAYEIVLAKGVNVLASGSSSKTFLSQSGGEVAFSLSAFASSDDNGWGRFLSYGYLSNKDPINGLSSLSMSFSASTEWTIKYGDSSTLEGATSESSSGSELSSSFGNSSPDYFKISFAKAARIVSASILYSCL